MIHSLRVSSRVQAKLEPINTKTKTFTLTTPRHMKRVLWMRLTTGTFRGKRREELLISAAVRVRLLANPTEDLKRQAIPPTPVNIPVLATLHQPHYADFKIRLNYVPVWQYPSKY